jgi:PKD repeat protein
VICALCLCVSSRLAADANAAWVEPVSISQLDASAREPQVAVDAAGNLTAVWTSGASGSRSVRSAFRPAGGSWEAPFTRMTSTHDCHDPRLAVNPSGAASLVARCEKASAEVWAAHRPAASWNGSLPIPGSAAGEGARVGVDNAGNTTVVWSGPGSTVQAAYKPDAAGTWNPVAQVSTVGKLAFNPNVGVSPAGYAYAVWREKREEKVSDPVVHVKISTSLKGAKWSTPSLLTLDSGLGATTPVTEGEPQIDINPGAERMMAWSLAGTKETMGERTAFTDLAGLSEPAQFISEATAHVEVPQIALDANGLGVATWRSGNEFVIKAATTSSLAGAWSSPATLSGVLTAFNDPDAAAGPAGTATVVWRAGSTAIAATRTGPGTFSAATPISNSSHTDFGEPTVTMDGAGDSIVAWSANDMSSTHIAVAVDDVSPPVLSAIVTPPGVEAGASASMSASATDTWSPASITWDFGDGAQATGNAVSHAYAATGTRTVTVTATDAVGNTTSQTRQVSVTAKGGGGGNGGGRVALTAAVVKQPWRKIQKAKAIKLRCKLDVNGTCAAKASVASGVAKRLGLKPAKGVKTATVGRGSAKARAGQLEIVKVRLTAKALTAIDGAIKPVPIVLEVTGSASGGEPAAKSLKLKIPRP